ncbi:MAG: hypothetical protein IT584_03250 [Chlamydiae bacterium]|nr:hypothetical protein [Chlamydiota bacterium]
MPVVPVLRCQHNDKEGVSPGDLAGHAVNGEVNQGLNDIGIDVGGAVDAICEAVGNEVLRPDVPWGEP